MDGWMDGCVLVYFYVLADLFAYVQCSVVGYFLYTISRVYHVYVCMYGMYVRGKYILEIYIRDLWFIICVYEIGFYFYIHYTR